MGEVEIAGSINPAVVTWALALDGFSGAEIGRGFKRWLDSGNKTTPDLPEFKAMCKTDQDKAPMYNRWRPDRAIADEGRKVKNKIAARQGIDKLKQILNR